jgi:hypothetical protein
MGRGVSSKSSSAAVKTVLPIGQEELRLALIVSQVPVGEFGSCLRGSEGSRSVGQRLWFARHPVLNECYRLWLLKNSYQRNSQK